MQTTEAATKDATGKANKWWQKPAVKQALLIFIIMRIFFTGWAVVALAASPVPEEPDEVLRPYLGQPSLTKGVAGLLLGPWQRFDTQRYMRIAQGGYAHEEDSVFPPLYPLAVRALGTLFGGGPVANLAAGVVISNLACLGLLILLHRVTTAELGAQYATRTLVYFVLFPSGFFLFAAYTEPLFILLALGSVWAARNGRLWAAGVLGFLASLTRLTGWILIFPLAYEYWQQTMASKEAGKKPSRAALLAVFLPPLGLAAFMGLRWGLGLPPLGAMYAQYWYQQTGFPGVDLVTAVHSMFFGGAARAGEFTLYFDFAVTLFLLATTVLTFRRLGATYGLYAAMLLLFMLLPTSALKPLYSFSRYALAFFPTFMLMGMWGERPWINRLIVYPSVALTLYFSGQFFIWGWVA